MRAINFLILLLVCAALVLFSLENTSEVAINVIEGVDIKAPLCIELLGAMGIGAILAWAYSILSRLQLRSCTILNNPEAAAHQTLVPCFEPGNENLVGCCL